MEITINLPEQTVRKVRAFGILCGGGGDLEETLVGLIDETLTAAIIGAVGRGDEVVVETAVPQRVARAAAPVSPLVDHSGISSGLGDEDTSEEGATSDEMAFVPKNGGGVSGADVERDMEVDDPEHEAKVEAPEVSPELNGHPERLFADMADMPEPPKVAKPDPRNERRRKPLKSKARVTGFTGNETSTF